MIFDDFSPIVLIKTTENADNNGGLLRVCKSKVSIFENASFGEPSVSSLNQGEMKTEASETDAEKSTTYCHFHRRFREF